MGYSTFIIGGSNPAIRTLYYRLVKLLDYQIQPLFIFDGPHKPPFKRNKKTGNGSMAPNFLTKQLLRLFGFPIHMAPGEAEAECAYLQQEGIVDAVLSEDVDTLMFGCGLTLRNWSSEGARGNKTPTHISAYYATETKEGKSGLDREGMILVALMSGGDYITEGIPGCGPKIACEAARAGFGKSLCRISRSDPTALGEWRKNLAHEIQTNESKHFRSKHNALRIPEDFPNKEVLGYYTHPIVSSASKIERLKEGIEWNEEVNVQGLRQFVAEAFDWTGKIGATKYIRTIAPALLSQKLRLRGSRRDSGYGDLILTAMNEMELVREICGKRTHISSDGIPEVRVVYRPLDIVRLDLEDEPDDSADYGRDGLAPVLNDDQIEAYQSDDNGKSRSESPLKRAASQYDPSQPDKEWIPETIVRLGVPLKLEDFEESQRNPKKFLKQKAAAKKAASKRGAKNVPQQGAIEKFVTISKTRPKEKEVSGSPKMHQAPLYEDNLPPVFLPPCSDGVSDEEDSEIPSFTRKSTRPITSEPKPATSKARTRKKKTSKTRPPPSSTPWGIASQMGGSVVTKPLNARPSKSKSPSPARFRRTSFSIDLTSSPPSSKEHDSLLSKPRKHLHSPELSESDSELPSLSNINISSLSTPPTSKDRNPLKPPPRKRTSLESASLPDTPECTLSESPSSAKTQELDIRDILKSPGVGLRRGRARGRSTKSMTQRRPSSPEPPTIEKFFRPLSSAKKTPEKKTNQVITLSSSPPPPLSPILPSTRHQDANQKTTFVTKSILLSSSPTTMPPPPRPSFAKETPQRFPEEPEFSPEDPLATKNKFIIARDSVPGGWKPIGEEEMEELEKKNRGQRDGKTRKAWRMSQVEVLDLIND